MNDKQNRLDWLEDIVQDAEQDPHGYYMYAKGVIHAFEEHGTITETEQNQYIARIREAMENAQ
ncbi:hypothetical protein [Acinetobacter bereziniae]|uniref:hypothetical protein n=1 Tax=Acinetobacter bereziniae TaxID=106648 RepID=UPI001116AE0D|nr:hypothetical protein [Acinetobacter bereziniae]TNL52032.1 hypothetical protein EYB59_06170 [Acinetobacter bereziniae]TNL61277.1 hypothetical protein EYY58_06625 [Acinetobacter bereziniae]